MKSRTLRILKTTKFLPLVYGLGFSSLNTTGMMKLLDGSRALGLCHSGATVLQASSRCSNFTAPNVTSKSNGANRRCQIRLVHNYYHLYMGCKCKQEKIGVVQLIQLFYFYFCTKHSCSQYEKRLNILLSPVFRSTPSFEVFPEGTYVRSGLIGCL